MCLSVALSAYMLFFYICYLWASLTLLLLHSTSRPCHFGVVHSFLLVEGFFLPSPLRDPLARGAEDMHICTISALGFQLSVMPHLHMLIFPFICAFYPPILLSGFSMGTIADFDFTRIEHSAYT